MTWLDQCRGSTGFSKKLQFFGDFGGNRGPPQEPHKLNLCDMFECTGCYQSFDPMDLHFGACMHPVCRPCLAFLRHQCLSCQRPFGDQAVVAALQARITSLRLYRRMYTMLQRQDPALACDLFNAAAGDQSPGRTPLRGPSAGGAGAAAPPTVLDSLDTRLRALEAAFAPLSSDALALNPFDEDEETRSVEEVPLALRALPLPPLPQPQPAPPQPSQPSQPPQPHPHPMRGASGPSRVYRPASPSPSSPPRLVRQNAFVGDVAGSSSSTRRRRRDPRADESEERTHHRRRLLVLSSPSGSDTE